MPRRIHLLDELVANQIAAGEVVERPASIAKELAENALDAGARRIVVAVENGGRSLVRVTDDGWGMGRDDALLCLERHATSKVRTPSDLNAIGTMGFRGEAMPSIASVSHMKIRTRERGSLSGTEVKIAGGRIESVSEAGMPEGTEVEVRRLFYNTPARRKFLRTEATETAQIEHLLQVLALGNPSVGWTLLVDGRTAWSVPPVEEPARRIKDLRGAEFFASLLPIEAAREPYCLHGWIGRAGVSRGSRADETWFVNCRPVDSRPLYYGLREGYHNALMKGRHPVAVLSLDLPPEFVDVNVHPAKREVRFRDDMGIRQFIADTVRDCLGQPADTPLRVSFSPHNSPAPQILHSAGDTAGESVVDIAPPQPCSIGQDQSSSDQAPGLEPTPAPVTPDKAGELGLLLPRVSRPQPMDAATWMRRDFGPLRLRVIGVLHKLYILAESDEGLVVIDQHAAHERVMFEKMLKSIAAGQAPSQKLLMPVTLTLSPKDADALRGILPILAEAGLGIHEFGKDAFMVDAVPPFFPQEKTAEMVTRILDDVAGEGGRTRTSRHLSEEKIVRAACRAAIKANDAISPAEVESLLESLLACDLPYTCPHGRPTMFLTSCQDLEKKFGRVV